MLAATVAVLAIVLAAAIGGPAAARAKDALQRFMLRHNNAIMMVVFAAIGAKLLAEGLEILLGG